jgi:sugar phosphate isomerase/epimerase
MLALSTSWQSSASINVETMLAALENLDIDSIELSYRIPESVYPRLKDSLKRTDLSVVSIHNFFPIPSVKFKSKGSGDLFLLSSPDDEERQRAIRWTIKSIEHANEFGAAAVVLHCGYVEMNHEIHVFNQYMHSNQIHTQEAQNFIQNKLKERNLRKANYISCLLSSLDCLVSMAEKHNVLLGLENRYHYHELPTPDDFGTIFSKFKGAPLGYWHDTGHAHANETLGLISKQTLLQTYAARLIGIHLHDSIGIDDHLAPGFGEIDFSALKPYLKRDTIKVIELKPGIPESEVLEGIRFIRKTVLNKQEID